MPADSLTNSSSAALLARLWRSLPPLVIAAAGVASYRNSFLNPFLFDDQRRISENPAIRHLWPLWKTLGDTTRPVVQLSFSFNYALGGLNVWGYHAVNLAIHLLAGLVLFGIVRRTLAGERLKARYGNASQGLALAVALLWVVHPLQTQSVTYLVQRAESLMGLFYLLTLYCVIRNKEEPHRTGWGIFAVVSCALGMGSKPILVTAPIVVALYDRIFLAESRSELFRRARGLYGALAGTWGILGALLAAGAVQTAATAGWGMKGMTTLGYAMTQPGVILHYLKLSFWPQGLVFDYGWPVARGLGEILIPSVIIGGFLIVTLWALRRRPEVGFLGAWFFLILAPSSSIIPIADPAFEHRMYLPLAAVVVGVVLGMEAILRRGIYSGYTRRWVGVGLVGVSVMTLGGLTLRRNEDYRSEHTIWQDVVNKRPGNYRGHYNLGVVLTEEGDEQGAIAHYTEALRLKPDEPVIHNNLGALLANQGQLEEAMVHYAKALQLKPDFAEAHYNWGLDLARMGKMDEAARHYTEVLRLDPSNLQAHSNLGQLLIRQGRVEEGRRHLKAARKGGPAT